MEVYSWSPAGGAVIGRHEQQVGWLNILRSLRKSPPSARTISPRRALQSPGMVLLSDFLTTTRLATGLAARARPRDFTPELGAATLSQLPAGRLSRKRVYKERLEAEKNHHLSHLRSPSKQTKLPLPKQQPTNQQQTKIKMSKAIVSVA